MLLHQTLMIVTGVAVLGLGLLLTWMAIQEKKSQKEHSDE